MPHLQRRCFLLPTWPSYIKSGYIYGTYQQMGMYDFDITWADGYYGLAVDETGEALVEPYEWDTITFNYVIQPNQAPKAKMVKKINTTNLKKVAMPNKAFKTSDKLIIKK